MTNIELGKHFMQAVQAGDVAAARACFHEDARIWHNFDNQEQSVDDNMATLELMIAKAGQREYKLHRLEAVEGGYIQRHTLTISSPDGSSKANAEALALVSVRDGKIARIEEFIDPTPLLGILRAE